MGGIELVMLGCLAIWIGLLTLWGQFWQTNQQLEVSETKLQELPRVCAVIPARNEAHLLPVSLRSLLDQDYPGSFTIILVDDHSTDNTAQVAKETAIALGKEKQLHVLTAQPLPPGWSGKLWAMQQGIQAVQNPTPNPSPQEGRGKEAEVGYFDKQLNPGDSTPDYFLLTDADIQHDVANLRRLVAKAVEEDLDLVSVMVRLRCESFWEKLLIPAFVFFFQKLYPFCWVNDPNKATAAAAGGCILIRRQALEQIGGIEAIRHALIDDCALAAAVKSTAKSQEFSPTPPLPPPPHLPISPSPHLPTSPSPPRKRIWLGLSNLTRSLRPYPDLGTIWDMVARTAFTQLNYSPLLLVGTLLGMTLVYLVPPLGVILGAVSGNWLVAAIGLLTWLLMTIAYLPIIRFYNCSFWFAFCLPAIALLYTLMTLDSALRHWQGRGGAWKGRVYPG